MAQVNAHFNFKGEGISARNDLIAQYRRSARNRGLPFELSVEQCEILFKGNCHYCGAKPSLVYKNPFTEYTYNTIDRKHNQYGYDEHNCVSACWSCNQRKHTKSYEAFMRTKDTIICPKCELRDRAIDSTHPSLCDVCYRAYQKDYRERRKHK